MFATTHWSVVVRAGDSRSPEAASAMERLCQTYWYPLYVFVRRKGHGHEDASDLTQEFFHRFLERNALAAVQPAVGKFRSFILACLKNFLANQRERERAQRRGGGQPILSLQSGEAETRYSLEQADQRTPEAMFERRWAFAVLERTKKGKWLARMLSDDDLKEHGNMVDAATKHMSQFRDILMGKVATQDVPAPPSPPTASG